MRLRFEDDDLRRLYSEAGFRLPQFGRELTRQFRKKVGALDQAPDERALRNLKSLHYEKLKGGRTGERSVRLNKQWRLILRLEKDSQGRLVAIIKIDDYH
jgi:proteic killer suppression protein